MKEKMTTFIGGFIAFILLCFCGQPAAQQYRDKQQQKKQMLVATKVEEDERLRKKTSAKPNGKKINPFGKSHDGTMPPPVLHRVSRPQTQKK